MEDITFAGLIGVGVGALATIGTQGFLGWLDRRNGSRTAARLLYGDILEARDIMFAALREGSWATRRDFAHIDKAWRDHREAVARAIGAQAFHDVAGAFKAIEFVQLVREANAAPHQGFEHARPRMEQAIPLCDQARLVLARAGCSFWERWITLRPKMGEPQPLNPQAE